MPVFVKASAKSVQMPPRKIGEVASLVRGRTVTDALEILNHVPRRAAIPVSKVIKSAAANAVNNHSLIEDSLVIDTLNVSPGPRLKRYRPIARGRANPFQRKTTHIMVTVSGDEKRAKSKATTPKSTTKANKTKTTVKEKK